MRYTLRAEKDFANKAYPLAAYGNRTETTDAYPRYGVFYENIQDPQGRAMWIAGGKVSVIDTQNNEVLGEFIRYSFEPGFGNTSGGRMPWAFSKICPIPTYGGRGYHIRLFTERVIQPTQER